MTKAWRHHTDNGIAILIHSNPAAEHVRIAAKLALPQSIANQHSISETGHRILGPIDAAERRLRSQKLKIVRVRGQHFDPLGVISAAQGGAHRPDHGDFLEHTGPIPQVFQLRYGHANILSPNSGQVVEDAHQPAWLLEREGWQDHRVAQRENCQVGADSERERKHGNRSKTWSLQKTAIRVLKVLQRLLHPENGALVAVELLGLIDAAVRAPGFKLRIGGRHAAAFKLVFEKRKVRIHFPGKFTLREPTMEKGIQFSE